MKETKDNRNEREDDGFEIDKIIWATTNSIIFDPHQYSLSEL